MVIAIMEHLQPLLLIVVCSAISLGCEKRETAQSTPHPQQSTPTTMTSAQPKAEVKVLANGNLFLDGMPATLDAIDGRFAELAKAKGGVWYYREALQAEPPPIASKVVKLAIKHRLPILISSKPDFSDSVDDKGVSHPRRPGGGPPAAGG